MKLPRQYQWLAGVGQLPPHLNYALSEYGTWEWAKGSNPEIISWAKEIGGWEASYYTSDAIPWCGLFTAVSIHRAYNFKQPNYLRALAWASYGVSKPLNQAKLGDILTFTRNGGGHVGFYIAEDDKYFFVLGGNQGDQVNIRKFPKSRLYSVNAVKGAELYPSYKKYFLNAREVVSTNEA